MASVGFILLASGSACEPRRRPLLVLLVASNNDGVIAACGCPGNPSGGFAKRQGLVEHYRRTRPWVLVLDAGNLFPERKHEVKWKYLARAAAGAGYDAIALGDRDFALGPGRIRDLRRAYDLPLICANVRDEKGRRLVPPHVIREKDGVTVGVFAVIADRVYGWPPLEWRKGLVVEPPLEAARREAQTLAGCDLVVALSHQPLEDTRRLAAEVPGIDVVVCGHDPATLREPEQVGGAVLIGAGDAGRVLGALAIHRRPDEGLEFSYDLTTLSARVPGAQWVEDLYWRYVKEAKVSAPPEWDTPVPKVFEPAEACAKCHPAQYKRWKRTAHAHAYDSIKKAGRHEDPECLMCHTMGFGREGGFVATRESPRLGRVTCQACHVVTSRHEKEGFDPEPAIRISSRLCMSCHGPVRSPNFDYFTYKPRILHPREDSDADN